MIGLDYALVCCCLFFLLLKLDASSTTLRNTVPPTVGLTILCRHLPAVIDISKAFFLILPTFQLESHPHDNRKWYRTPQR